ncbi:uncharacterized protein [Epargyreus clarus]|uniref:uncharacterized protein n=1 Tax=Epargyreus clarus TaxID=520877 RepID=UPI003C2EE9C9
MEAGYSGAMGSDEKEAKKEEAEERVSEKKKLNDDLAVFMRKCSESDVPRYFAKMKNYVKLQQKRKRADAARKRSEHGPGGREARKKAEIEQKEKPSDSCVRQGGEEDHQNRRRGPGEKAPGHGSGSVSGHRSQEPVDRCCCRRRRSRRRRSCRRRRRRRSCRRRRRRSRCRRRRRRSCRRRRRR